MPKINPALSAAILQMPKDKKDKLLLRLIAKDALLIKQLHFDLLEDQSGVEERVDEVKAGIASVLKEAEKYRFTPGELMMTMRSLNARITEHVKVTKDQLSEVTLTIFLLHQAFEIHLSSLQKFSADRSHTFAEYVLRRTDFVLKKADKLHEDYHLEFADTLQKLLDFIHQFKPTAVLAKELGVPRHWGG
jgi:hypothetical protein